MSPGTEFIDAYSDALRARSLQRRADIATNFRLVAAVPVGLAIAATEPNWAVTTADVGVWATDATDGRDAGESRRLNPEADRTPASKRDPLADKLKYYAGLVGIGTRAIREHDVETSVVVGANIAVSALRDVAMHRDRKLAKAYKFDTDAIRKNKWKTRMHAGASIVLASPLSQNKIVRRAALGTLSAGTLLGVAGQMEYRDSLYEHIGS